MVKSKSGDRGERYWRTYLRKLGEDLDLAGKAIVAAVGAAMLAPLATKGVIGFPSPAIGGILAFGLVVVLLGIHLQAQAKPDDA